MIENTDYIPQIKTSPYQAPMHQYGGSIILLTNPESQLYKLELSLRGLREKEDGELIPVGEPKINDEGINTILGIIQSSVSQNTFMSNLEKKELPALTMFLADTVAKSLMMNRERFGIKNAVVRDEIFYIVVNTAYIAMKRPFEQGERKFWGRVQQDIRTEIVGGQKQGSGILSAINPFKKS